MGESPEKPKDKNVEKTPTLRERLKLFREKLQKEGKEWKPALDEAKKGLDEERRFSETLKETLEVEKKKAAALEEALNKAKNISAKPEPAPKTGPQAQPNNTKKTDRSSKNW